MRTKQRIAPNRLLRAVVGWLGIFLVSVISLQAYSADLADIQRRGVIRIAVPLDYPPFGMIAPDLSLLGYDIDKGMTLILVAHEMRFAREVGDRVVFMHQGCIHEQGPAKTVMGNPQPLELQQFLVVSR